MNVAALNIEAIAETPKAHAEEVGRIEHLDAPALRRLQAIALIYSRGIEPAEYDSNVHGELLYQLKSARERFDLWDDLTIARAIKRLRDPTGW